MLHIKAVAGPPRCRLVCLERADRLAGVSTSWRRMPFTVIGVAEGGRWWVDRPAAPSLVAGPGTVLVVPAEAHHRLRVDCARRMVTTWAYLELSDTAGMGLLGAEPFLLARHASLTVCAVFDRVLACPEDSCLRGLVMQAAAGDLGAALLGACLRPNGGPSPQRLRIEPALRRIEEHPDRPISRDGLARLCGLSASRFHTLFLACLGQPPAAYTLDVRLRQVRSLLATSAAGVDQIAQSCGFDSAFHLCRHFRSRFGASPGAWRRSLQEDRAIGVEEHAGPAPVPAAPSSPP